MNTSNSISLSKSLLVILAIFLSNSIAFSMSDIDQNIKKLPSYLNSSNAGSEFYLSIPSIYLESMQPHDGCYLYISSKYETTVTITNDAKGTQKVIKTKPNDIVKVQIDPNDIQAYSNTNGSVNGHGLSETVIPNQALHIVSNDPIVIYGCVKYSYTSDAFLAIPTSAWGQEYVVNTYRSHAWTKPDRNLASMTTILAAYDDTKVIFTLNGDITTNTVGGLITGQSKTFMLNKGDVVAIASGMMSINGTLAGSKIISDKPVGVISGVQCADVPSDRPWCDYLLEMELPVSTWGTEYHVTKNFNRNAGPLIQVVAKEPNTTVSVNGDVVATLKEIPNTNLVEWVELNAKGELWNGSTGNVVVSSDKPISVTMFNQGQSLDNIVNDPFQLICYPINQYRDEIVVATPGIGDSAGFKQNYLNIVYPLNDQGEIPDDLIFGVMNGNDIVWEQLKVKFGPNHSQLFHGTQNGKKYAVKNITLQFDGVYHLKSNDAIGCYSYGMSSYDSYGMPSFVGLKDNSVMDDIAPDFIFVQNADGSIGGTEKNEYAEIQDKGITQNGYSNIGNVFVRSEYTSNYNVEIKTFVAGMDRSAFFKANVIDETKDAQLVISTFDKAGNDTTIVITHKALTTSVAEKASDKFLKVYPSITNGGTITIELSQGTDFTSTVSLVGLGGKVIQTFDNLPTTNSLQSVQFNTNELPIGMYYVLYTVNGKQYQQSFVKMK